MKPGALAVLGAAAATALLAAACSGPASPPRHPPPSTRLEVTDPDPDPDALHMSNSPALALDVASGCPDSVRGDADVVNSYGGPTLVPAPAPTRGIVCWYQGANAASPGALARQVRLGAASAATLAGAVRALDLRAPSGSFGCPAAFGVVALIGFAYATGPDVALWYEATGCQTLDNGRIGAFEGANPSFYDGFDGALAAAAPMPAGIDGPVG